MIESYRFGKIVIDGVAYTSDIIIYPDHVQSGWWRKEGHNLAVGDLEEVIKRKPETLVVGTGYSGAMTVPEATREALIANGIDLVILKTTDACNEFNDLEKYGKVVGAFHLTC